MSTEQKPDGCTQEDWAFVQTIAAVYNNELARTGNESAAHKVAEHARRALIGARAVTAARKTR